MSRARLPLLVLAAIFLALPPAGAAPWIAPDWAGKEPQFPRGSLYWKTEEYPTCPVLFRTVLDVERRPVEFAGFRARVPQFAYVFLNGRQVAALTDKNPSSEPRELDVELTPWLRPGRNVLVVSTKADGFALAGGIGTRGGAYRAFGTDAKGWKVQKLKPLTILEDEPLMRPEFDDGKWFAVAEVTEGHPPLALSQQEVREVCDRLSRQRLQGLDADAGWRLQMLAQKGIAIADWEASGFGGAGRLPDEVRALAAPIIYKDLPAPGTEHLRAEALTRYVLMSDEAANLEGQAAGLQALNAPPAEADACRRAAAAMRPLLVQALASLQARQSDKALTALEQARAASEPARKGRLVNDLNRCLDNKFGWFDTNALLENDPAGWGLQLSPAPEVYASPLSPACLVTVPGRELSIQGFDGLQPLKQYQKPLTLGPVCLWAVLGGKVTGLKPGAGGVVYDAAANGKLGENWVLLASDMERGGQLPTQIVFLQAPSRITFKAGEKGTSAVTITFDKPGGRLFLLRPLKEWRGFLLEARALVAGPDKEPAAARYVAPCRLWSQAVLDTPVSFSEAFVRDPNDKRAVNVADTYVYRHFQDEWGTKPMRLAPLPPLACYGLMVGYPGLKLLGKAETLGSWGIWGDQIAAVGQDTITYRVPLDPFKRFGGFTSYCFGDTDIGGPGSLREIETIKATGANSFRPQHNKTGERALKTLQWCWENGLQNVFNTDEKWVPDVVEHYRTLAKECKGFPPDAVAYDLLNEPETRDPRAYGALMKKITAAIRESDKTHLIYVEAMPPWGPGAAPFPKGAFETLEPTGDPLTVYSFHDYEYRLPARWPNEKNDVRDILTRWIPAFRYAIDHRTPIHLGEFGGFEQTKESVYDNACALTMMTDYLNVFDHFGWHWHYYANRGTLRIREDGSLQESYVQQAVRRYYARGTVALTNE